MNLRKRKRETKKKKTGGDLLPPRQLFACLSLSRLSHSHCLRAWNRLSPRWEVNLGKNPAKATFGRFEKTIIMLSSILTPCGLFCVNSDRSSPWNSCQLFLFLLLFFLFLPTPLNSGIVGFYRKDVGRWRWRNHLI